MDKKSMDTECMICSKTFKSKTNLRRHIATIHLKTPVRHHCPLCEKNFTRKDNLNTHLRKIHDQQNITKKRTKRQPWKDIESEKPAEFIPPFEARPRTCSIRRKHQFPHDNITSRYVKDPVLTNCSMDIIPEQLRPSISPPKPTQNGIFPPIATKAIINKGTAKIWIRRTKLIINKRPYCTSDYDHSPVFTTEFKRWDQANLKTLNENTDTLKQKMSKKEKLYRIEKNNNYIDLHSTIEIPASMATPAPLLGNLPNESNPNRNLESKYDRDILEKDLELSDSEEEDDVINENFSRSISCITNTLDELIANLKNKN